jgi:hypothetical protein
LPEPVHATAEAGNSEVPTQTPRCVIDRSATIVRTELELRRALIITVVNEGPSIMRHRFTDAVSCPDLYL